MYQVQIDRSLCSGYGFCADLAPDLFELDGEGLASLRVGLTDDASVLEVASACPMAAILITEVQAA